MHKIEHYELHAQHPVACQLKAGCVVRVDAGRLWLTLQGRVNDVWLQGGEAWVLPIDGTLWLSAEPVVRFHIAQPLARRAWRLALPKRQGTLNANSSLGNPVWASAA